MYASGWPSELAGAPARPVGNRQRAEGRVAIAVRSVGGRTRIDTLGERGSARLRVPRCDGRALEAVLINTAGGITGGDRFDYVAQAAGGADLTITTAAAEKVYRAESEAARVGVELRAAPGARVEWLPQETILFDRARLHRSLAAEVAGDARLLLFEAVVFGRAARGECVVEGFFEDRWRVYRDGRLVYADTLRLAGAIAEQLARAAIAGGNRALATALYVAPDAEARLEDARAILDALEVECGASAWNGCLVVRFLGPDIARLRADAACFLAAFRRRPLPRVWQF